MSSAPRPHLGVVVRIDGASAIVHTESGLLSVRITSSTLASAPEGGLTPGDRVSVLDGFVINVAPRRTALLRHAAGAAVGAQAVAANVDLVLIAVPLGGRWQPRRVERSLALAWSSGAKPVLLLTKADLSTDVRSDVTAAAAIAGAAPVLAVSSDGTGLDRLRSLLARDTTAVLLGPSGAGKSTLVNLLAGREVLAVGGVRSDGKGRHTTSHREMVVTLDGALLIDSPGTRSLGLWEAREGIEEVFSDLAELAVNCRFSDCAHQQEPGCAVRAATVDDPSITGRLESWRKLEREQRRLDAMDDPRAGRARRRELRRFARSIRDQPHR